ncbi:hypothetical protein ACWC0D_32615, partial [Streptomyces sp. NPDC001719]
MAGSAGRVCSVMLWFSVCVFSDGFWFLFFSMRSVVVVVSVDVVVPVRVRALALNEMWETQPFSRWYPNFRFMAEDGARAEFVGALNQEVIGEEYGSRFRNVGVVVQWELPEALAQGFYDPVAGESSFPLVPNRWLVVRYANEAGGTRRLAKGWVVHSDYLDTDYYPGRPPAGRQGTTVFGPARGMPWPPRGEYHSLIGRVHNLSAPSEEEEYTEWGPWREPGEAVAKDLFLTAAGPGLPAFPAFEPYHRNVFSLYDNLLDTAEYYPNWKNDVSYQVVGWYSDPARDVLARPGDIPGVPAGALPGEVLAALGWKAEGLGEGDTLGRSLYCGTALGMKWDAHHDLFPPSKIPPSLWEDMKVAVGHSTAEVTGELTSRQTSDALTGELVQALFQGTIDTFGTAVGEEQFEEATRRAWYVGEDGGYVWQIVRRGEDDTAPVPPPPAWLEELNTA